MIITMHKQSQIDGYHVAYNCTGQKFLNVNQKQTHPKNPKSEGNYSVNHDQKVYEYLQKLPIV
jgi:hypothetical protein